MRKLQQKNNHEEVKEKTDIVTFLMQNVYKQNKIEFYTNLETSKLEELISSVFTDHKIDHERKVFVVSLLKKNTFILSTAFGHPQFDFKSIFELIFENEVTIEKISSLQEMLLPFGKKFPEKVLELLKMKPYIKRALFQHIYMKPIFKILYTVVFCIDKHQIEENQEVMKQIMQIMVFSLFQYTPDSIPQKKTTPLFDIVNIPGNHKDFLADLTINLSEVEVYILLNQVKLLNAQFISKLMILFSKFKDQENFSQYCENIVLIFVNIAKIFQSLKIKEKNQKQFAEIQDSLHNTCKQIASNIPFFTNFLLSSSKIMLPSSSGQIITTVGMVRYRTLELVQKLLSINQIQDIAIDFDQFDFFPVIELYIQRYKWNNIVHNLVLKITELLISRDYKHFRERHILDIERYDQGFFGNLIANFRNRKFIFLHSMKMMDHGNRYPVYQLSKLLVNQMSQKNDLSFLVQNFKVWKQFMEKDMKDFQINSETNSKLSNNVQPISEKRPGNNSFEYSGGNQIAAHYVKSLETFQQVMLKLREQEKWSPKLKIAKEDKCKLIQLQKLDSLSGFALQKR